MARCIIITACLNSDIRANISIRPDDYLICADGGFDLVKTADIVPDTIIGDFDSISHPNIENIINSENIYAKTELIRAKPEKDDTDTMMCVKHGLDKGYKDFVILGGLHDRLDHTIANIQALSNIIDNGRSAWIMDGSNRATMIKGPDELTLYKEGFDYFSIFSYTEKCLGIYEINAKYTLNDATLSQTAPIGTSNEFINESVLIKVREGKLLIIQSS